MTNQIAYCVKCGKKMSMTNEKKLKSKNGRNMVQGNCSKCGTKMSVFTK